MSKLYQRLDAPHYDYALYELDELPGEPFRGPRADLSRPFLAFIGGAQTFGRFTAEPFAAEVAAKLGMGCLNLGLGGAGPRYALRPEVLALLNRASAVVVQFCSGRSASCSLFDNGAQGRNSGKRLFDGKHMPYEQFFKWVLAKDDPELTARVVAETREDYAYSMRAVAAAITAPKVALWISRRVPRYQPDWVARFGWMNLFPQLVDDGVVRRVAPAFDAYVECVSQEGVPQPLWSADAAVEGTYRGPDGRLYNEYYPTPQMHHRAAAMLLPVCARLVAERGREAAAGG